MFDVFKEPTVLVGTLCIPFIVIAIAKNWQRIKEKKAEKAAAAANQQSQTPQS